ncbi:MAG: hypothetical protein ACLGJC_10080 [Alphaproteobacteria bacterium]
MAYDDALEEDERDLNDGRADHEDDGDDEHERHDQDGDRGDNTDDGDDHGEESAEGRRSARAEQRRLEKERRRRARERDQQMIRQQAQELAELRAMVSGIAQRTDMGALETHLAQAGSTLRQTQAKLREAIESGDFDQQVALQDELYTARRRVEDLEALKQRATQQARQPQQPAQRQQPAVNTAKLAAFQEAFFDENPWFNQNLADEDSRSAAKLSEDLAGEGYAPDTPAHWRELRARLREQRPHLFGGKQAAQQQRQPGRSPVGGSGGSRGAQPGGRADERRLPPEYVKTLKDANLWDDPATRKQMTDEYFASAKRHGV